jgi:hypothetical protein
MVATHTGLVPWTWQPWPAGHTGEPPWQAPALQVSPVLQTVVLHDPETLANAQLYELAPLEEQVPDAAWQGFVVCEQVTAAPATHAPAPSQWSFWVQPLLSALHEVVLGVGR